MAEMRYVIDDGIVYREAVISEGYGSSERTQVLSRDAFCRDDEELGIAYDEEIGLIRHGRASHMQSWADDASEKLFRAGDIGREMANDIAVATFPATVESLDALSDLIGTSGIVAVRRFLDRIGRLQVPAVPPR